MQNITISLDVMGGDFGAAVTLKGAEIALARHNNLFFILVGDEALIKNELLSTPLLAKKSEIVHTEVSIKMDDKPSKALRYGRKVSSMWRSIDMVKEGRAQAAVSAGNTGALMAMATFNLKMREGIDRPAIAGLWPTVKGTSVVLDLGATIGATAKDLYHYALMGTCMASILFNKTKPTVGLLNVGVEEMKGVEYIREAGEIIRANALSFMDYHGFVEGSDIGKGVVDVVVTEGFSGNIALKTAEGTAKQVGEYLKIAFKSSVFSKIGYLLAKRGLGILREKLDPSRVNGGVFLGLNGIVIKSHGGTDPLGFACAIDLAITIAKQDLLAKINVMMNNFATLSEIKND